MYRILKYIRHPSFVAVAVYPPGAWVEEAQQHSWGIPVVILTALGDVGCLPIALRGRLHESVPDLSIISDRPPFWSTGG